MKSLLLSLFFYSFSFSQSYDYERLNLFEARAELMKVQSKNKQHNVVDDKSLIIKDYQTAKSIAESSFVSYVW